MKKTYYRAADGRIGDVSVSEKHPGEGWDEGPSDIYKYIGEPLEWFDKKMNRIPDEELVKQGKRKDNRGKWFKKDAPS